MYDSLNISHLIHWIRHLIHVVNPVNLITPMSIYLIIALFSFMHNPLLSQTTDTDSNSYSIPMEQYSIVKKNHWFAELLNSNGNLNTHTLNMDRGYITHEFLYTKECISLNVYCTKHNKIIQIHIPISGSWDNGNEPNQYYDTEYLNNP
jgi:hypothetical protein